VSAVPLPTPVAAALLGLLGAVLGSFIATVVDRLQRNEPWATGRSRCDACRKTLAPWELVPIVSFFLLRGRCRRCDAAISRWNLGIEVVLAALFVAVLLAPPELGPSALPLQLALLTLGVGLFVSDVRYGTLPDLLSLPAIALALLGMALDGHIVGSLIGAAVGLAVFGLQFLVSRGRWVGSGDLRIGALAGAVLGWPYVLLALLLAYVGGAVIASVLLIVKKVRTGDRVPMGGFLVPAVLVVQWFGASLLERLFPLLQ
jgi:prepilin signal peptidase PulO-like enzyme (type II secretory pathway)